MSLNKLRLIALAGLAFACIPQVHAGVEVVEPDYAPAPRYNYVPPRPTVVYYAPQPVVYVEPLYAYRRPYYRYHAPHRFYRGAGHWRGGYHRR